MHWAGGQAEAIASLALVFRAVFVKRAYQNENDEYKQ